MAEKSNKPDVISKFEAVGFVWEVFAAIAVPATALALLGRWADERFNTSHWLTILGLFLSLVISGYLVSKKAMSFAKRMKTKPNP